MPRICVFDVNETLLDLQALDPHFQRAFGDATIRQAWFAQLLQSAFISMIIGDYGGESRGIKREIVPLFAADPPPTSAPDRPQRVGRGTGLAQRQERPGIPGCAGEATGGWQCGPRCE